ncbi:hypothetical protein OOT00_09570 [Desulfobotulus sp. H1]|uniref:CstA N-terminal domain-containing protein n=1 Tax=Desulfobotulus pelophilus TaxID=2823377 RepID=A0ABT3N9V7_9BACT|nr:hypothetical protein [Desulfobotulus pelophilus]
MNILVLLLAGLVFLGAGYLFYGRMIARIFDENDQNPTPAIAMEDGRDYVPARTGIAFSHHFASIAGAGPIVGPTVAMLFGIIPVWLWLLLGTVFFGAVHDYTCLFASVREKGRSMAEVSRSTLGKAGFFLFIAFTTVMILLVTSAFLGLSATALTSLVPVAEMKISGSGFLQTIVGADGIERAKIGGIASTSVIILTLFAPLIGWMLYRRNIRSAIVTPVAVTIVTLSVIFGIFFPVSVGMHTWMIILTVYVVIACGAPVWTLLQPRDFMNSFILFAGILLLLAGIVVAGLKGAVTQAPAFNVAQGNLKLGMIWPFLFITVACGAISGFHSLVAGGTVSKQIRLESDARKIGYGGMVLEGVFAMAVLLTLAAGLSFDTYLQIVWPESGASNPILAFALSMGSLLHMAFGFPVAFGTIFGILMVEGFVVTTLDTAVRLNRYLFEELWSVLFKKVPAILRSYIFNAALSAGLMLWLSWTNAFTLIWPIFGAANQLLAALGLIAVSVWLARRKKPTLFTLIPAILMLVTTVWALWVMLFDKYIPAGKMPLIVTDILLMVLALAVMVVALKEMRRILRSSHS